MLRAPANFQIEEVTDPREIQAAKAQREQFDRNSGWLQANIAQVYRQHRGKHICIAGQEVFAADDVLTAISAATATHPTDSGWFTRYIPKEKMFRVYANQR
jgi:hypothetical protein